MNKRKGKREVGKGFKENKNIRMKKGWIGIEVDGEDIREEIIEGEKWMGNEIEMSGRGIGEKDKKKIGIWNLERVRKSKDES